LATRALQRRSLIWQLAQIRANAWLYHVTSPENEGIHRLLRF